MKTGRSIVFGAILLAACLCEAGETSKFIAKLEPVAPFPALQAAAKADGIPWEGIDPPARADSLCAGDSVTALITLHEKNRHRTQWLIYLQATNGSKGVSAEQPDAMVLYTSTGRKFEFAGSPATLGVRTIGPFVEPNSKRGQPSFTDKSARVSVNKDFLSLGFDRGAAAVMRWNQDGLQKDVTNFIGSLTFSSQPLAVPQTNHASELAARLQVTSEEERSVAGWIPALSSYFGTVAQTPNLKGIMLKVLKLPSLWSFIRNAGVSVSIKIDHNGVSPFSTAGWGMPSGSPVFAMPGMISINNHKALALTWIVTAPRPPLLACGGIIGLLAENPADAENYLTVRVISAHGGTRK